MTFFSSLKPIIFCSKLKAVCLKHSNGVILYIQYVNAWSFPQLVWKCCFGCLSSCVAYPHPADQRHKAIACWGDPTVRCSLIWAGLFKQNRWMDPKEYTCLYTLQYECCTCFTPPLNQWVSSTWPLVKCNALCKGIGAISTRATSAAAFCDL